MWNRSGSGSRAKSSALERAMAHLQRQRGPTRTDRLVVQMPAAAAAELQEHLGSLTKMTHTRISEAARSRLFRNLGDISSDESAPEQQLVDAGRGGREDPAAAGGTRSPVVSRFLKKASFPQLTSSNPSLEMIETTEGRSAGTGLGQHRSQSLALSRLALVEDRIRSRRQATSGSGAGADPPPPAAAESSAESSRSGVEPSVKGSRFLKKRDGPAILRKDPNVTAASSCTAPQPKFVSKGVNLDSDEEDMKKLLGNYVHSDEILLDEGRPVPQDTSVPSQQGSSSYSVESASVVGSLSSSPSNITTTGKTLSSSPQLLRPSQSSVGAPSDVRSLDELFVDGPPSTDSTCEKSILSDEFKINVMTLDDLAPDVSGTSQTSKKEAKTTVNAFEETKSSSHSPKGVDANEEVTEGELEPAEADYESDFESEIKTETEQNVSDTSELRGARSRDRTASSEGQDSVSERLQQHDLSSQSEREGEAPRSELNLIQSGANKYSESRSSCSRGSYSRIASEAITPLQRECTPSESRNVRDTATQTQADGLSYTCSTGMATLGPLGGISYTDPTPVASGIVCTEALEAFTAYNPAVLVLNDMLRQQLALTRQFVETSRHLHNSVLESLGPANYHYATLRDTKEFIKSHKPPRLTMEEALEEVLQEMREYHYI
ncbi:uncharacterized protein C19orf44 homolog isoform X2 [Scleropages formosus]|uniref:uncharacterized protein C19orf44 homolog isoform X2 n=1 Tax=Scleropages formosus TaxID=113540 RepID=UPI0010FAAFDA|nr:uncharacterized protein C19orf44 homolog isoform X2 [Scleropages formosus]